MSPKYFAFNIEKHHLVANMKTGYILNHKLIQVKDQLEQCKQPIKFCNYFCENYGDDPRCGQCKGKTFYAKGFFVKFRLQLQPGPCNLLSQMLRIKVTS